MSQTGDRGCRWLVSGRVQGVGFRWFVRRQADALGLVGWARNLPDGRVQVVARGPSEALVRLEVALRKGPSFSSVDNVEKADIPHEEIDLNFFDIR